MFAFHSIGRQDESFLKADEERLKDFRSRLQYLARGVQVCAQWTFTILEMASENLISRLMFNYLKGYIKKLREFLAKPPAGTSPEDKKLKQVALRTNENIQVIIGWYFRLLHNFTVTS